MDITYQYPPDLLNLLVDTIPLLNKGKEDVFVFFRGAGVSDALMQPILDMWNANNGGVKKAGIARQVLVNLNKRGEATLRERREVLRRVVEFEAFAACWPNDQLKAKGLVSEIRSVVNVKDSFTRMRQEHEKGLQARRSVKEAEAQDLQRKVTAVANAKAELFALFGEKNAWKRGKRLERALNRVFQSYGIPVQEAFTVIGMESEGIVEQIDGVIQIDGHLYFVEMKWWNDPIGVPQIAEHMVRVFLRAESRALIISASGFTSPAITTCKDALVKKVVALCTLEDFVKVLDQQLDLLAFLKSKIHAAITRKDPYHDPISAGEIKSFVKLPSDQTTQG